MPAILKIRGITKTYPGVRALQDVSFDVECGSIHAIMGENGAGKSTLMQIIAGAQRPDSGTIEFDGREVHFASPAEAQAIGIAIVYQELNLSPNLSIAENVFLGLEPRSAGAFVDRKTLRAKTSAILSTLGIHFDPDTIVGYLTVAQQQLVEICKSLVRNPRLLIFDEPTSSLSEADSRILFRVIADLKAHGVTMLYISQPTRGVDVGTRAEIYTLFDELARAGVPILMISSDLPEVLGLADRIIVMRQGRITGELTRAEATEEKIMHLAAIGTDNVPS